VFLVTSTADSSGATADGTLRGEIGAANAHFGNNKIVFDASVAGTITLRYGELFIASGDNLTINGPGAGTLTVSGSNSSRVFDFNYSTIDTIQGLTITGGYFGYGGGIFNQGTLTVNECTVSGNSTNFGEGGGIYNASQGTLTVKDSTLSGNSARIGGGIYNDDFATLTVKDSTLSGNTATAIGNPPFNGVGGGIFNNQAGTVTVSGSTLSGNSAIASPGSNGFGGAISNAGTMTVEDSTLSGNSANFGGAIDNGGTLTVKGSTLSGNSANFGGAIDNEFGAMLTVSGSTVGGSTPMAANVASSAGGGIYNANGATLTVTNSSTITGNTAPVGFGADVYNLGVLYLDATSVIGILDGNPAKPL
jgi:hypothetical protein